VNALSTRYSKNPNVDRRQHAIEYREAMRQVPSRYPDDLDAATLYAELIMNLRPWQLWSADGIPAEGTLEVLEVLEGVLRRDPAILAPITATLMWASRRWGLITKVAQSSREGLTSE
jgi:hypothetical protein